MKKIIKSSAFLFVVFLLATSCEESAIEPLTGIYEIPVEYSLTNLFARTKSKQDNGSRIFTLKMASDGINAAYNEATSSYSFSGSGNYVSIDFVGNKYYLEKGTYTFANKENAKAGNYIAGYDSVNAENLGTSFFSVNNGTESANKVVSGNISVDISDSTNYEISGALTLSDESVIRISYKGTIVFEQEIEKPIELSNVFATTVQPKDGGYQLITIKISTSDVTATYNEATYSYTFTGNGNYVSIDFLSNSDTLDSGTYTAAANDVATVGNFIQGYDTELWGMQFYNWGSCWFAIEDGAETGKHIFGGNISVSRNGSTYTITITGTTEEGENIFAEYKGAITAFGG
jgi:hypothetical protein